MKLILILLTVSYAFAVPTVAVCWAQTATDEIAPGNALPSNGGAWALDSADGKPVLVQIKHHNVRVNNHTAENMAVPPLFGKAKSSIDIVEVHSPVQLQAGAAIFLVRIYVADEDEGIPAHPEGEYQLIRLQPAGKGRLVHRFEYSRFKGKAKRVDDLVESTITRIPGTEWLKIVPAHPLPAGEYAIEATETDTAAYPLEVYDFGISGQPAGTN
jgi:hypothetical protein